MALPIDRILDELTRAVESGIDRGFLRKCFHNYASRAHRYNITRDLDLVRRLAPPPGCLLDFGCGAGIQSLLLADLGYDVTGIDTVLDKSIVGFLKKDFDDYLATRDAGTEAVWRVIERRASRARFRFYDGRRIPFPDRSFQAVVAYAVLEHIPKPELPQAAVELARVLTPGGRLFVFQLPQASSYSEFIARTLGLESHENLWTRRGITVLLEATGLRVEHTERTDMLINHPYRLINPVFPVLRPVGALLLRTPLAYFAHHLTVVARRP